MKTTTTTFTVLEDGTTSITFTLDGAGDRDGIRVVMPDDRERDELYALLTAIMQAHQDDATRPIRPRRE